MPAFDVSIDLTTDAIPPGLAPPVAVERVRAAVAAIPGAGFVSVAWCSGTAPRDAWVRGSQSGRSHAFDGAMGDRLAGWVRTEARRALFPALALA